jgi:hypothetical protein
MFRVILRISFNKDYGSTVGNKVKKIANDLGLENTKTGTLESNDIDLTEASRLLGEIFVAINDGVANAIAKAEAEGDITGSRLVNLDHFWVYIDQVKPEDN